MDRMLMSLVTALWVNLVIGNKLASHPGTKTWTFDLNFHNPVLWNGGQLPRSCDRAVFPAEAFISVFVQSNVTVRELILPDNGELVLGSGISFTLEENPVDCLDGRDIQLLAPVASSVDYWDIPDAWYSPDNWYSLTSWYSPNAWSVSPEDKPETPNPVPETERVPCQMDRVVFPVNSSYQVNIDTIPPVVSSVSVAGKDLNTVGFEAMLDTPSGKLHFSVSTLLVINNNTCTHVTGCPCGNDKVKSLVCRLAKCKELDCSDPVTPAGGCCPLCGAVVMVNYKDGFEFSKLQKLYSSFMNKPEYQSISGYVSNIGEQRVQAVFADSVESHRAGTLAGTITAYLNQDLNEVGSYEISSVTYQASSHWTAHPYLGERALSMGQVMGLVFGFIAILYTSIYASTKYKKYSLSSLSFSRLRELKDDLDIDSDDVHEDEQQVRSFPPESTLGKGFDNPMYDELKSSATKTLDSSSDASKSEGKVVSTEMRENPAFTVFEELEHLTQESLLE